jgi:hypothetical protein
MEVGTENTETEYGIHAHRICPDAPSARRRSRQRPALPIGHTPEGIGRMQTDDPGSDAEVEID